MRLSGEFELQLDVLPYIAHAGDIGDVDVEVMIVDGRGGRAGELRLAGERHLHAERRRSCDIVNRQIAVDLKRDRLPDADGRRHA